MDLGSALLRAAHLTQGLAPGLIGRWFATLLQGTPIATTIADVPVVRGEVALALFGHYAIGTVLTASFAGLVVLLGRRDDRRFVVLAALLFGLLTNLLPWLWMFPAMGYGTFGRMAPAEWLLTRSSFANHLCFAIGLACATLLWQGSGRRSEASPSMEPD